MSIPVVRCASSSQVKLQAVVKALEQVFPYSLYRISECPVELQDRPDLEVNALPVGEEQTTAYANLRLDEMQRQYKDTAHLDVVIESGLFAGGLDVAVVVLANSDGERIVELSEGIPVPVQAIAEAELRGFKTTTPGDIMHEWDPNVPANNWQAHYPPYISRVDQIADAIVAGLRRL